MCMIVHSRDRCSVSKTFAQHSAAKQTAPRSLLILTRRERHKDRITHSPTRDANMIIGDVFLCRSQKISLAAASLTQVHGAQTSFACLGVLSTCQSARPKSAAEWSNSISKKSRRAKIQIDSVTFIRLSNEIWYGLSALVTLCLMRAMAQQMTGDVEKSERDGDQLLVAFCYFLRSHSAPPNKWYPAVDYSSGSFRRNAIFPAVPCKAPG